MTIHIILLNTSVVFLAATCVLLAYQQIVIFKRIATLASVIEAVLKVAMQRKDK